MILHYSLAILSTNDNALSLLFFANAPMSGYYTYFSIEFGKSSYIKRGSICNVLLIQADMIDGIQYGGRPKQNHIT